MKKVMEESKGIVSRKDALQALRRFNLEPERLASYTDEFIINQYRARVGNVGAYEVPELREHLRKIGVYRQSQAIMDAAGDGTCLFDPQIDLSVMLMFWQSFKHMIRLWHGWGQMIATAMIK